MARGSDDESALCQKCGVQTRESKLDAKGECAECQKSRTIHTAYVVIWISGVHIVGGGVYNFCEPSSLSGGRPLVVHESHAPNLHAARKLAREWYERELPSVSRAYPVLTFY